MTTIVLGFIDLVSNVMLELILCKEAVAALKYLPPEVIALDKFIPVPALTIFPVEFPIFETVPGRTTPVIGLPLDVIGRAWPPPIPTFLKEVPGLGRVEIEWSSNIISPIVLSSDSR